MSANAAIHGSYNLGLVALSIVLALVSSFAALDLAGRVASTRGRIRAIWLAGGSVSMGIGIWAMHYVGMLAFTMPLPVLYHVPTVVLSLFAAIFASGVALFVVGQPEKLGRELAGGLTMGLGIAAMHYIGMAALRSSAVIVYDPGIVVCSVLLAVLISFIALKLTFQVRDQQKTSWRKIVSALVMGSAIPSMHYMGMWAATFHSSDAAVDLANSISVSMIGGLAITIASFFVLGGAIASSFIDRFLVLHRSDLRTLQESELHFHTLAETIPEIIWTANPDGATDFSNKKWLDYSGLTLEQTSGLGWTAAVHPDDLNDCRSKWEQAQRTGSPYRTEIRFRNKNGNYRHFLFCANPLRDSSGAIAKWFGTCTDIETQKESQKILEERVLERSKQLADANMRLKEEQYFRTMTVALPEIIWTADPQGQVDYVNRRLDYVGLTLDQIRGSAWVEAIHPDDLPLVMEKWRTVLSTGQPYEVEYRLHGKDGTDRWFLVRANAIRDDHGEIVKWIGTCTDIETQKRSQEILEQQVFERTTQLKDANERLQKESYFRLMADAVPQFIWTSNSQGNVDYCNRCTLDYCGLTINELGGMGWLKAAVHPDDKAARQEKLERALRTGEPYDLEYRLRGKDGEYRWFLLRARPIRNEAGEIEKWIGTCTDIENQKQNQKVLEEQILERTMQLADANTRLQEEMVEKDFARNELDIQNEKMMSELEKRSERATMLAKMGELLQSCISRDEVFAAALGYAPKIFPAVRGALALLNDARNLAEVTGSWAECVIPVREFEPSQCWALRTGHPHFVVAGDTTARCRHAEGVNGTYLCVPIMAQGETLGVLHFQVTEEAPQMDPSELSFKTTFAGQVGLSIANIRLREALRTQSVRDPLTSLYNRRYLEEILEREVRRAGRAGQSLGILMLDLDHFKSFNDTYGHDAGDTVLRETAAFLLKNVRAEDFVCRFGGEEFVVILPTADLEGARGRGERFRAKMRDLTIMRQGKSLGMITFSIGVAAFPQHGMSPKELMASADAALYEAKRGGRDQVVVATKLAAEIPVEEVSKSVASWS
jgi:diguanylate cyclase (GGDEF)-like protein/PAS domain S-box-containing protein